MIMILSVHDLSDPVSASF